MDALLIGIVLCGVILLLIYFWKSGIFSIRDNNFTGIGTDREQPIDSRQELRNSGKQLKSARDTTTDAIKTNNDITGNITDARNEIQSTIELLQQIKARQQNTKL